MKHRILLLCLGLLCLSCSNFTPSPKPSITYVANCGFIVQVGDYKVVIDGLLGNSEDDYFLLPTDSVVDLMREARAPFDDISLILVTHDHNDHFDAEITAEHMANNSEAILMGSSQVDQKLRKTAYYQQIKERIKVIPNVIDSLVKLTERGIKVTAIPYEHGPYTDIDTSTGIEFNRHANVEHLEFVVDVAGITFFHSGDALMNDVERYESFGFGAVTIDMAMVAWWDKREMISFRQKLIRDVIRPKRVFMTHMSPNRPPHGEPEKQTMVASEIILPKTRMQKWVLDETMVDHSK